MKYARRQPADDGKGQRRVYLDDGRQPMLAVEEFAVLGYADGVAVELPMV